MTENDALSAESDASSIQSVSTATYERQEQEAAETFKRQIEKLIQDLWPPSRSLKDRISSTQAARRLRSKSLFRSMVPAPQVPNVKHLKGGGYNHITAIELPPKYGEEAKRHLILRIPREYNDARPEQQVATLNYVRERTSIPVPTVSAVDFSNDNALGRPYVIQHRVPGVDLESVWDTLSPQQRYIIASEVGRLIKTLLATECPTAGTIEAIKSELGHPTDAARVVPFKLKDTYGELLNINADTSPAPELRPQTTLSLLESNLSCWRNAALTKNDAEFIFQAPLYQDLIRVTREMHTLNLFTPDANCLCHLDLHPRNIMVQIPSASSIHITGILDWDDAVIAPKFVNCQPPGWLWGYDKDTHTENSLLPWPYELEGANALPATLEQRELKGIFDECAGDEYVRLAYGHESRLMRGLFRLATLGLTASWHDVAAERIVREWDELMPSLVPLPEV
ncbi:hypothetical protein ACLMJK_009694 [Lecanora helva]